jgi:hypothetical protein
MYSAYATSEDGLRWEWHGVALVLRFLEEVWNRGNLDVIDERIAPEFVQHDPAAPEEMRGPADARRYVQMNRSTFPTFGSP